ncbi:MAG: hypothetical protein JOZ22_23925, partial [Acidobacteriia bacterium]|nr:hypothetical protein [Terriglobia bacterium]
DDLADRDLTAVSWVLNQNLGAERLPYRLSPGCFTAFGPAYALLRSSFRDERYPPRRRVSNRVLISFGGGDTAEITAAALRALEEVGQPLTIVCILGPNAESRAVTFRSRHAIRVLGQVQDMAQWMNWADISVNAGGSTCWELCCLGVPMLIAVLAPNQRPGACALAEYGCAILIGDWTPGAAFPDLAPAVECLLEHPRQRRRMASKGQELVDGKGAVRAARLLIETVERGSGGGNHVS